FYLVKRGQLIPKNFVFPRIAQLREIVSLVLVVAVHTGEFGRTGAGNGGFEAIRLANDEVRGNTAIRPASDAKFVGVCDSLFKGVVHHGHVVLEILVTPVRPDGPAEVLAVAG